jgi:hypothetical protein
LERFDTPPSPPAEVPTGCLFCGGSLSGEQRTREHIFPRWLLRRYEWGKDGIAPMHASPDFELISGRIHRLSDLVEGRICRDCNGGWMSRLEVEVQPILTPLIDATRPLESNDGAARLVLARWAAKSAYVLNWSANYPRKVPLAHLRALVETPELHPRVVVMAAAHAGPSSLFWVQGPTWQIDAPGVLFEDVQTLAARSYKITMQIGSVILLVAFWPGEYWRYSLANDVHRNVWPPFGLWNIRYPGGWPEFEDPIGPSHWFHFMLGVASPDAVKGLNLLVR